MNTGVMLMNIEYLREHIDADAIQRFTLKNKWKLTLYDQDVLCKFFGNKIKLADRNKYNLADRHITVQNMFRKKKDKIEYWKLSKNENTVLSIIFPSTCLLQRLRFDAT